MRFLLAIFIGITFMGCEDPKPLKLTSENLNGNWQFCDNQYEYYCEILIKDTSFHFIQGINMIASVKYSYEIMNDDSIKVSYKNKGKLIGKIILLDSDNIQSTFYKPSGEVFKFDLRRIQDEIQLPSSQFADKDSLFSYQFSERGKKFQCK
ncbi:MAG: hypothetical protein ACPGSO_07670 [Vicingaceae bacterium]